MATEDPVTITLEAHNVPNIELVDLPGLQDFPPALASVTQSILSKYLADLDTVLVCVVEATSSIITSPAVAQVLKSKRQESTVLALTCCDLVPAHEVDDKLFKRIARMSMDIRSAGVAGCVALANGGMGEYTLVEVEAAEASFFGDLLSQVPENGPYVLGEMTQNVTGVRLIGKIAALLHRRIRDTWRPLAISQLASLLAATNESLQVMGAPPAMLPPEDVILAFMHVAHEDMLAPARCDFFRRKLDDMHAVMPYEPTREYARNALRRVHKVLAQYVGSPGCSPLLADVRSLYTAEGSGFLETFPNDNHLMLVRFDRLAQMARVCVGEALDAHGAELVATCHAAGLDQLMRGVDDMAAVAAAVVDRLFAYLGIVVAQPLFVDKSDSHVYKNFHANRGYFLVESDAWVAQLAGSRVLIERIGQATAAIEYIDSLHVAK
eukprot:jgi/Mesvir1/14187/Mv09644-RA.1